MRKVDQITTDPPAAEEAYARMIDESGEDDLYPTDYVVPIELPAVGPRVLAAPV